MNYCIRIQKASAVRYKVNKDYIIFVFLKNSIFSIIMLSSITGSNLKLFFLTKPVMIPWLLWKGRTLLIPVCVSGLTFCLLVVFHLTGIMNSGETTVY